MISISSLDDPRIQPYRSMTQAAQLYERERVVVAEGAKVVRRVLQSDLQMVSFFATARYYEQFSSELAAKQLRGDISPDRCYIADKTLMSGIVGYKLHEGILALAHEPPRTYLYDAARTIALPAVCLCGITDSENVGAIVRNCVAFGIPSLIVDASASSPYLRRAVRVSLGGIFGMQVYYSHDIPGDMLELKETRGIRAIAAETGANAIPLPSFTFPSEYVLLFGSEGYGLPSDILRAADDIVQIPMQPRSDAAFAVNSLNVAASSAIVLYHAQRGALAGR